MHSVQEDHFSQKTELKIAIFKTLFEISSNFSKKAAKNTST